MSEVDLLAPLHQYWGYSAFRPLQERIVRSLVDGNDTCVIMPTGGGKSLCYQLPALVLGKTTVVISPLIALMQDQAAQLAQMGIPAAVLNSTMSSSEQSRIMIKAREGEYRLLYLSPERLAREDSISWLRNVPISFFAIDEAHCISEWGHEFRPDYRLLSRLRANFPQAHIAAFTASATQRVRHDILHQLQLRAPHKYIASFHRPNLRYAVKECKSQQMLQLLLTLLRNYREGNIIIYEPTIARVEQTVDFLEENGFAATAYHGKMEPALRKRNQEAWMSDEVRVLVGTIAFGLGINKATVRAVIHMSLPKSIEQYYQEAGRAGRDGNPADCILLWQKQDAALLAHFMKQIGDAQERNRAWDRYHIIRAFADSNSCRQRQICEHFGEKPKWETCGVCDVCSGPPAGLSANAPLASPKVVAMPDVDETLRDYLREWRRNTAHEQGSPAFVVMHDTALDEICHKQPRTIPELLKVTGFGQRKAQMYGPQLFAALERFREGARAAAVPKPISRPAAATKHLLDEGQSFAEIAAIRGRQLSTIINSVSELIENGDVEFKDGWVDPLRLKEIEEACARLGTAGLRPIKDAVSAEVSFDDIRLVSAKVRWEAKQQKRAAV
ncbi:MAG TPA: RecQ family ATP-dependent DNA helicase [Terriglobales bacterium]|jgi:ATP-dependent DNA helicase RecQ|nr:RecQ family ATP-dependent DNA helicase [Terriglobales bacterium]